MQGIRQIMAGPAFFDPALGTFLIFFGDSVDLVAPGVDISSCIPGGQYRMDSGTSMAAPHVTAAVAMLLLEDQTLEPKEIERKLKESATDLGDPGWDYYYGAGLINLKKLLNQDESVVDGVINDSWEEIISSISNNTYKTKYHIGDLKNLDLGSEGTVEMQIVAFDADELADGNGKAAISWISKQLLNSSYEMNPSLEDEVIFDRVLYKCSTGAVGGWEYSNLRKWLRWDVKKMMPNTVQDGIKKVKKYSASIGDDYPYNPEKNNCTFDEVWIPSYREICGAFDESESSGPVYNGVFPTAGFDERIKYKNNETSSSSWWLRTALSRHGFAAVGSSGISEYIASGNEAAVAIGFCL